MKNVIVIGGGIAGLTAGWMLQRASKDVLVIEAANKAGGNMCTDNSDGYTYEMGPHTFLPSADAIWDLINALDMNDEVVNADACANTRFVYRNDKLHKLPLGPMSFMSTGILSFSGKLRLMMEPFIKAKASDTDTAFEFFARRLGKEATTWLVSPFISGIYAGDPNQLGARDAFTKMWTWEKQAGGMISGARKYMKSRRKSHPATAARKGLYTFKGGLGNITDKLANNLGAHLNTSEQVRVIQKAKYGWDVETDVATYRTRNILMAIPPKHASRLLTPTSEKAGKLLDSIELAPVAVVHLGVCGEEANAIPDGFGFLVPRNQGVRTLGCIFASKMFPDRAPDGCELLTCYVGGVFDKNAVNESNEKLLEDVLDDLHKLLGQKFSPSFAGILRHPMAIPQLTLGHREKIKTLFDYEHEIGEMFFAGNYLLGVGCNDAAQSGINAAEKIIRLT